MILAILASLIFWPAYIALSIVLYVIGAVILLPLSVFDAVVIRASKYYPPYWHGNDVVIDAWKGGWLTWLWGNEEDGVSGPGWWRAEGRAKGWKLWRTEYVWTALRNPASNLRFVPFINPIINPARIRSRGGFVWQGLYAGYIAFPTIFGKQFRIWIGWKLKAEDAQGVPDDDMRKVRCGFALQFKVNS